MNASKASALFADPGGARTSFVKGVVEAKEDQHVGDDGEADQRGDDRPQEQHGKEQESHRWSRDESFHECAKVGDASAMDALFANLEHAFLTGEPLDDAIGAYFQHAKATPAERAAMLGRLESLLRARPPSIDRCGAIGLLAGALVEISDEEVGESFPMAVFDLLLAELKSLPSDPEAAEEFEFSEGYYLLERAAMAYLSRSATRRATLPQRDALRQNLRRYGERYGFLGKMLHVLDDEPFLVLDAENRRGFRLRAFGIADNFQLHALLREALTAGPMPPRHAIPGESFPADASAVLHGRGTTDASIGSNWQLMTWRGLTTKHAEKIDTSAWIWNEGFPAEIPLCAPLGVRVILIHVGGIHRSWHPHRIFDAMDGRVVVDAVLEPHEVAAALAALA